MDCYAIRSVHLAPLAYRVHQQKAWNEVHNNGNGLTISVTNGDSRRGGFKALRTFKETEGGFSQRLQNLLNKAVERDGGVF